MNKNCVLVVVFVFLIISVQSNKYFKKNFHNKLYKTDPQCRYVKEFAYDGLLYKTKYFSLIYFFNELSKKNCTSSIKYECSKQNFLYTDFSSVLYAYFCEKKSFYEMCSKLLTDWTKQTSKYLLKLNNKELSSLLLKHNSFINKNMENCISVPMFSSYDLLTAKNLNFYELKHFDMFNITWTMLPGVSTDFNEKKNGKR